MRRGKAVRNMIGALGLFILACVIVCPLPGYGEENIDKSSQEAISVAGASSDEGQDLYFKTDMNASRVTGVEKAVLANRAYTFVATGGLHPQPAALLYFWDYGSLSPKEPYQHPVETEQRILNIPGGSQPDRFFWTFKTCVFKNRLYVFFATEKGRDIDNNLEDGTIYSMSAGPAEGDKPTEEGKPKPQPPKPLQFQDEAEIGAALKKKQVVASGIDRHRRISAAGVIGGKMYLIYATCFNPGQLDLIYTWYYTETEDGVKWSDPVIIRRFDSTFPQSAVTFVASDPTDPTKPATERVMLAYSRFKPLGHGEPGIVFFDGKKLYGEKTIPGDTQNIVLALGTVKGATSDKQTIQLWCTDGGEGHQKGIYHAEYVPDGPGGDQGSFVRESVWTKMDKEGYWTARTDPWFGLDLPSMQFWTPGRWLVAWSVGTVFETYDPREQRMQQYLELTFHQRWVYWFLQGFDARIKTLRYFSDVMKWDATAELDTSNPPEGTKPEDFKYLWVLLGVIEGPPPVPANGHDLRELTEQVTRVTVGSSSSKSFTQSFTAQEALQIGMHFGNPLEGPAYGGFSIGPQFMQQRQKTTTTTTGIVTTVGIDTTSRIPSDDVGQLVIMRPMIVNNKYKVFGWDGKVQVGPTYNALRITEAHLTYEPYSLTNPDADWFSRGMVHRFKTTDYEGWHQFRPPLNDPDYTGIMSDGILQCGKGTSSLKYLQREKTTQDTNSYGFTVQGDFSLFNQVLSLDISASASFDWAFTWTNVLNDNVEWYLRLPDNTGSTAGVDRIRVQPYYLQARTTGKNAWWIPDYYRKRGAEPWCITYHVAEIIPGPAPEGSGADASAAGQTADLTIGVPQGGGVVTSTYLGGQPVEGSANFEVTPGDTIDLQAAAAPGYEFRNWVFGSAEAMQHGSADEVQSWIVMSLGGVKSTVRAVFAKVLPKVAISLDDFHPGTDSIEITEAYLDEGLLGFDPGKDSLAVFVNGYKFSCTLEQGAWAKTGNTHIYSSDKPGEVVLVLDLDARNWSFFSSEAGIHRSLKSAGEDLSLGLSLNDTPFAQDLKATVKSSFQGKELDSSESAGLRGAAPDGGPSTGEELEVDERFKVLELQGTFDAANPDRCAFSAKGELQGMDGQDPWDLLEYGIVAFYFGDETVLQVRVSDCTYNKANGTLSYVSRLNRNLTRMSIDMKKGTWSIKTQGQTEGTIPDHIEDAYLVLYNDSPSEPGYNVGLGNDNYKALWVGGDLLTVKRKATLTAGRN